MYLILKLAESPSSGEIEVLIAPTSPWAGKPMGFYWGLPGVWGEWGLR